jgi:hypothetical protein
MLAEWGPEGVCRFFHPAQAHEKKGLDGASQNKIP